MNKVYNEPEFKVVLSNTADVITTSGAAPVASPEDWEMGQVPFGI